MERPGSVTADHRLPMWEWFGVPPFTGTGWFGTVVVV